MSWSRESDEPIHLLDGRELRTLLDAGLYIEALPNKTQDRSEWQTATKMLLFAAEEGGPVMFANIALLKALNAGKPKEGSIPASIRAAPPPF
jgi:hypothetical protein